MDVIERGHILSVPTDLNRTGIDVYHEILASGSAHDAIIDNRISIQKTFPGIVSGHVCHIEDLICIRRFYRCRNAADRERLERRLRILFRDVLPLGRQSCIGIKTDFILLFHIQPRTVYILKPISGKLPHGSVIIIGKM